MGFARLLRRRLGTHPVAVLAIVTSVMMSLVVVTALSLLSADIADSGVRTSLAVPPEERSFALAAALDPGGLDDADRAVRTAVAPLGEALVTRVATTTSRRSPTSWPAPGRGPPPRRRPGPGKGRSRSRCPRGPRRPSGSGWATRSASSTSSTRTPRASA